MAVQVVILCRRANQIRHINLSKSYKSVVALEFARKLLLVLQDTPSTEYCLDQITDTLNATGLEEVFGDCYCCCCPSDDIFSSFGMSPHPFVDVARHYVTDHSGMESWSHSIPEHDLLGGIHFENDVTIAQATRELFSGVNPHSIPFTDAFPLDA